MKILQIFITLDEQQASLLYEKYKDDVMVKTALKVHLDNGVTYECTKIKNEKEKAEKILNESEKL